MKFWHYILIGIGVMILGFWGWMNVTEGFFQAVCCEKVEYATYKEKAARYCDTCWVEPDVKQQMLNLFLLDLAKMDFNKGRSPDTRGVLPY